MRHQGLPEKNKCGEIDDKRDYFSVHWSDWALLLAMNLMALRVEFRYEQLEGIGVWEPAAG